MHEQFAIRRKLLPVRRQRFTELRRKIGLTLKPFTEPLRKIGLTRKRFTELPEKIILRQRKIGLTQHHPTHPPLPLAPPRRRKNKGRQSIFLPPIAQKHVYGFFSACIQAMVGMRQHTTHRFPKGTRSSPNAREKSRPKEPDQWRPKNVATPNVGRELPLRPLCAQRHDM